MFSYRSYIYFASLVAVGLAAAYFISEGYYPVAMVGNTFVSARTFSEEYQSASLYYQNVLKTYGPAAYGSSTVTRADIEASIMQGLIEDAIIREGAKQEIGNDLGGLIQDKIGKYAKDEELHKAAAVLYGLTEKAFTEDILVPQATREIFAARLALKGRTFDDWFLATKKSARVIFFSPQFGWDGEKVESK